MKPPPCLQYLLPEPPAAGSVTDIAEGLKWLRMPLPFGLDHINIYLLRDGDGWLAIDTGMKGEAGRAVWRQVMAEHLDGLPLTGVLVTHMHPDHIGLAGWLVAEYQCRFFMSAGEYFVARTFEQQRGEARDEWRDDHYTRTVGLPDAVVAELRQQSGGYADFIEPLPPRFIRLQERDQLNINGELWRVIIGRGHSQEHLCLFNANRNLLIAGDQALPQVRANVGVIGTEPEANPLQDWLSSLSRLRHLPRETLVLPSHNAPYHGLHNRLDDIENYQRQRLQAALEAMVEPKSAYELLGVLYQKSLRGEQLMMAVGECLAHIRYLQAEEKISCISAVGEPERYQALAA